MAAYAYRPRRRYRPPARYRYRGSRRARGRDLVIVVVIAGVLASGATSKAARGAVLHAAAGITGPAPAGGTLSCSGLEALWQSAGGSRSAAFMAAEIAMAESSGRQYASLYNTNGTTDRGYWQINSVHGALSTFDAAGNAKAAVIISRNGTDFTPWTTYQSGAYAGRC